MLSHVQLFATPWTVASRAPLFMEFSRQEYWRGLPFHIWNLERLMEPMILHAGQQGRLRHKEQTFGLGGRRRGWDDLRE